MQPRPQGAFRRLALGAREKHPGDEVAPHDLEFDHFTSLSGREQQRNVSKYDWNSPAGRAELLFLIIKPVVSVALL